MQGGVQQQLELFGGCSGLHDGDGGLRKMQLRGRLPVLGALLPGERGLRVDLLEQRRLLFQRAHL